MIQPKDWDFTKSLPLRKIGDTTVRGFEPDPQRLATLALRSLADDLRPRESKVKSSRTYQWPKVYGKPKIIREMGEKLPEIPVVLHSNKVWSARREYGFYKEAI